eukprot:TRINITY_DN47275_c0_g1_i1.p1 TRINITY_DN47275_c0_g1~~TRINITY_DN47275_c0_g1_i1.p1  ORF type:complete len:781 (+),score=293.11 TRINITY_DN47275_c0_g1_i1:45-2345(+)
MHPVPLAPGPLPGPPAPTLAREVELEYAGRLSAERAHNEDHISMLRATLAEVNRHLEQETAQKRQALEELLRKEKLLNEITTQYEVFKEDHRRLLAIQMEDQRDALNAEKTRMNQHFIKTGKELHGKHMELHAAQQDIAKLSQECSMMKDWIDKGANACRKAADDNAKLRAALEETRGALGKVDTQADRRIAVAEQDRDRERGEKDAVSAALQSAQERILELQAANTGLTTSLTEVSMQARRQRRRMANLKGIIDRYTQPETAAVDPFSELDADADAEDEPIGVSGPAESAHDSMLRLHETLNGVQLASKQLLQAALAPRPADHVGAHAAAAHVGSLPMDQMWTQTTPGLDPLVPPGAEVTPGEDPRLRAAKEELEDMRHKLVRKGAKLEELEDELDGLRRNRLSASEETEAAQRAARAAREEADRLRDELDRLRLAKEQDTATSKHQLDLLADELKKLTEELEQIREYGKSVEQENDSLRRTLSGQEAAAKQHSDEQEAAFRQLQALHEHEGREHARMMEEYAAKLRWHEQQSQQELEGQQAHANQQKMMHQQEIEQLKLILQQQATASQRAMDQQRELMQQQQAAHQASTEQQHQQHQQQVQQLQQQNHLLQQQLFQLQSSRTQRPSNSVDPVRPSVSGHEATVSGTPARTEEQPQHPAPSGQPAAGPAVVVVHAPQPAQLAPSESARRQQWSVDPDDYGHASPAHMKLNCTLCGAEGFVPGIPCRNCGFSVGQYTRLVPGSAAGASRPDTGVNSAATSPRRWY